jgi:hypothetical protein
MIGTQFCQEGGRVTEPAGNVETNRRSVLLAVTGAALAIVLTALGTFADITGDESGNDGFRDYFPVIIIVLVVSAIVFGLVVRNAESGNPARRSLILGIIAFLSIGVFWAGLPSVLAAAATATALIDRDRTGRLSSAASGGIALAILAVVGAIVLAIAG